jgi:hypothetical protein
MLRWIERIWLKNALKANALVAAHGETLLGRYQWSLLCSFGKCMAGPPYGGQYVSGMPPSEVHKLLHSLEAGETVRIHLMHRHQSGDYESSSLRLGPRRELVMVYPDREIPAAELQDRQKGVADSS